MIIFENDGLIDVLAISIVGISVKAENSIGRYGTGIKYGIATILRGGGEITIWRGLERLKIGSRKKSVAGVEFDVVTINGKQAGFTTAMGRDWEPWMAFREFASNAMDEGGSYRMDDLDAGMAGIEGIEGKTIVAVDWPMMDGAYLNRGALFLEGEPDYETDEVRIFASPSPYLYYKGVRVKAGVNALLTYDMKKFQVLTEDRTLLSDQSARASAARALLRCEDAELIKVALMNAQGFENNLDFDTVTDEDYKVVAPTRAFIDACLECREVKKAYPKGARNVLMRYLREEEEGSTRYVSGKTYSHPALEWAICAADRLGLRIDEDDKEIPIVMVDELPGTTSMLFEKGRIYFLRSMLEGSRIALLKMLIQRIAEAKISTHHFAAGMDFMIPILMRTDDMVVEQEKIENAETPAEVVVEAPLF